MPISMLILWNLKHHFETSYQANLETAPGTFKQTNTVAHQNTFPISNGILNEGKHGLCKCCFYNAKKCRVIINSCAYETNGIIENLTNHTGVGGVHKALPMTYLSNYQHRKWCFNKLSKVTYCLKKDEPILTAKLM